MTGALVTIISEASGEALSQITDQAGEFRFEGLPARTYIVEIQGRGHQPSKQRDVQLRSGEARRLDTSLDKELVIMGGMMKPWQPLRILFSESDRIVVAKVKRAGDDKRGKNSLERVSLKVERTIKGDGHKSELDVYASGRPKEHGFIEGETVLAFLQRSDDVAMKGGYRTVYGSRSVMRLQAGSLEAYVRRLDELKELDSSDTKSVAGWLAQCAEDRATRWEGAYELALSARLETFHKETNVKVVDGGDQPGMVNVMNNLLAAAADSACVKPPDRDPLFASLLTSEQKERLLNIILESQKLIDGDLELIELASHWEDPRLLKFLLSYLKRAENEPHWAVMGVMQTLAEFYHDDQLRELLYQYRNGAANEEVVKKESEENEDEVEPADDADEEEAEDEDDSTSEESESEPEPTPEQVKAARADAVKKFIEIIEPKIKSAAAQR